MVRTHAFPFAMLALFALTTSASSETAPGSAAAAQVTLFARGSTDYRLFSLSTGAGAVHATAVACCKVSSVGKACGNS
jgi:hypothetical protein